MATALVILVFAIIIGALLWGGWTTERRRGVDDPDPTLEEHAAADAGRVGAVAGTGSHDAASVGAPTMLDAIDHDLPTGGRRR